MNREKKLGYILIVIFIISSCKMVSSQDKFISTKDFDSAYEENQDLKYLERSFDLLNILLLDSSRKQLFINYDSELRQLFEQYSKSMTLNKSTVGFHTHFTTVNEVLNERDKILNCLFQSSSVDENMHKIDYPIYINGNNAIMEISSPISSDLYFLRLHEGVAQINWLGGTIQ